MSSNNITALQDAKKQLSVIMGSLNRSHKEHLLSFAIEEWMAIKIGVDSGDCHQNDENVLDDPVAMLNKIVEEIREKLPLDAVLPSEKIFHPTKGVLSDCDPTTTVHVDAFLYNQDDVENLVANEQLSRHYCKDCGSRNIEPLTYISHSVSRDETYHVFNTLLPTLDGKIVVDVGSRLGAVLYGAFVYTDAEKIIGVEMNKDLCDLQNEIVRKYNMDKRIQIINKRIEDAGNILRTADVVILNNVFAFYLTEEEQTNVWKFLREHIKIGAYVICRPSLSESMNSLNTEINVDHWVEKVNAEDAPNYFGTDAKDELTTTDGMSEIFCYKVL